jgi:hypothetical protein
VAVNITLILCLLLISLYIRSGSEAKVKTVVKEKSVFKQLDNQASDDEGNRAND